MTTGELLAQRYDTSETVRVAWHQGVFTALEPTENCNPALGWIAPALFDPQINGYAGVDFQGDPPGPVQLSHAVAELRAAGCTRFLLTLITNEWPRLLDQLRHLRRLREADPELAASIAGWHVEGPFLSDLPGFHGAHNPVHMLDPTPRHLNELRSSAGNDPLLLTLAPERTGSQDAIRQARELGITVSLGHTNASAIQLAAALNAGASGFTHLGNACPREIDRHDNILWRVLDAPPPIISLIPDSIHVAPTLFRLLHRLLPPNSIIYTTDAMAAAGAPPGSYRLGDLELEVGPDQIVRQPGRTNFAGSALRPLDGVRRAAHMLRRPWQEVWDGFSVRPARFVGLSADLAPGARADFCLIEPKPGDALGRVRTFCAGRECSH